MEFFNALADGLDESLKKIGEQPIFEKLFGGTFADQKKCRDCPHMYEKEQLFTSIAVDIRSHNNLTASLNEYVTGDLLEGDNAYFCELCNAKVTAVKRLCIAKLPPFLMIQLKRFDMDWNRGSPVKFFDYFEFPAIIDMEPFTSKGVAKRENGMAMDASVASGGLVCATGDPHESTLYRLRGVVVHSGEAHGGHYYSYIADNKEDGKQQWYRFDDTDVVSWDFNEAVSLDVTHRKMYILIYILIFRKVELIGLEVIQMWHSQMKRIAVDFLLICSCMKASPSNSLNKFHRVQLDR